LQSDYGAEDKTVHLTGRRLQQLNNLPNGLNCVAGIDGHVQLSRTFLSHCGW